MTDDGGVGKWVIRSVGWGSFAALALFWLYGLLSSDSLGDVITWLIGGPIVLGMVWIGTETGVTKVVNKIRGRRTARIHREIAQNVADQELCFCDHLERSHDDGCTVSGCNCTGFWQDFDDTDRP